MRKKVTLLRFYLRISTPKRSLFNFRLIAAMGGFLSDKVQFLRSVPALGAVK
jgi:hypothetical protein